MPHDESTGGPRFSTQKYNPRVATKQSLKKLDEGFEKMSGGLLKGQVENAVYMDKIHIYRSDSGQPSPRVKWSPEVLLNGNHRYKWLQEHTSGTESAIASNGKTGSDHN